MKGLVLALGAKKPPKDDDDMPMGMSKDEDDFDTAASQAFDALQEDDLEGFKAALKNAVMACGYEGE